MFMQPQLYVCHVLLRNVKRRFAVILHIFRILQLAETSGGESVCFYCSRVAFVI